MGILYAHGRAQKSIALRLEALKCLLCQIQCLCLALGQCASTIKVIIDEFMILQARYVRRFTLRIGLKLAVSY